MKDSTAADLHSMAASDVIHNKRNCGFMSFIQGIICSAEQNMNDEALNNPSGSKLFNSPVWIILYY